MPINYYYYWLSPPSKFVLMVIKHLNLHVNLKVIDLGKGEQKNPEYLKVNGLMILF